MLMLYRLSMPQRMYPSDYYGECVTAPTTVETSVIPTWVPILLAIALIGAFAVALYSISKK